MLPDLKAIEFAAGIVHSVMPPTPQYCWPLLCERLGTEVWAKHENHTPVGAFKLRGGLVYFDALTAGKKDFKGVISATRGNHGQSVALAAQRHGLRATIVVPNGNSREKNAAMKALGAELIVHGEDFQASLEHAERLAAERSLHFVPSYHPLLVAGVATYSLELLTAVAGLDTVYVPIGLGSGISGMIAARNALGLKTEIVGVVSAHARAYAESFNTKQATDSPVSTVLADGMACRSPVPEALDIIWKGVERVVEVTDLEVGEAMRVIFESTHNVCEGAGAAAFAAACQEQSRIRGRKVGVVLTGGNIDRDVLAGVLQSSGDFSRGLDNQTENLTGRAHG